jgi:hypothetical protein
MYVESGALACGVFLAAVLIRDVISVRSGVHEIEVQLNGMQAEINTLLRRASRYLGPEHASPKTEVPVIDTREPLTEISSGGVYAKLAALSTVSIVPETWMRTLLSLKAHHSFSGVKIILIMSTVVASLVCIFVFERLPLQTDATAISTGFPINPQLAATAPPAQASPAMIESQDIPEAPAAEQEFQAPTLQMARRSETGPKETNVTARPPTLDLESTRRESGTADGGNVASSDLSTSSESSPREVQKRSPSPETDHAAMSATSSVAVQPIMPAPLPQVGSPSTETQNIAAKAEAKPRAQAPSGQSTPRSDGVTNDSKTEITTLPPASHLEMPSSRNRPTDDRPIGAAPHIGEAHPGVLTRCVVNLIPSGQIAVQQATSYQACIAVGTKCAGARRYINIEFFVQPSLTSMNSPELCNMTP